MAQARSPRSTARKMEKVRDELLQGGRLDEALIELHTIRAQIKTLEGAKSQLEADVLDLMAEADIDGPRVVEDGDSVFTATPVRPTRIVFDEPELEASLTKSQWEKVTKRVLDKDKLEAALQLGEIDFSVVDACSEEVANKPYVKFTDKR